MTVHVSPVQDIQQRNANAKMPTATKPINIPT